MLKIVKQNDSFRRNNPNPNPNPKPKSNTKNPNPKPKPKTNPNLTISYQGAGKLHSIVVLSPKIDKFAI